MAAPPSKQSPSNQKMHESDPTDNDRRLKDPPPSASLKMPTYESSESSEAYTVAKQLLNADNFEAALSIIEEELLQTTELIRSAGTIQTEDVELHESLAPLHYLYGTTLLYSLEEAKDENPNAQGMMTEEATKATSEAKPAAAAAADPSNPWAHLSAPAEEQQPPPSADDAMAEDIQIAWENLEAARTIVEKLLLQETTTSSKTESEIAKLQLDLAQIHLREGDLQRINGNYTSAIGDYSSCLEILVRHNHSEDADGTKRNLDRKIADTQFNLGLTYLTSSSDLHKELASGASEDDAANAEAIQKATALAKEHCGKGIQQHVDCARTFCGILAEMCGVDPESITTIAHTDEKPAAGFKTTGLEGYEDESASASAVASQSLNVWRKAVADLVVVQQTKNDEVTLTKILDIQQVLDEIQETVDEAERSQEGVRQAAAIRVQAQKAAAAMASEEGGVVTHQDGSTTTIGFGAATATTTAAATSTPMMVVKKKKKRPDDAKKSAAEEDSNSKRAKTE